MDFKSLDLNKLKKYLDPKAADDLNVFLEKLPLHAGQTVLIAAGIAWAMAAALGLFTAVQMQQLTKLRAELKETEALMPNVPSINNLPIETTEVNKFVEGAKGIYRGLSIQANGSTILITANNTSNFTEFRESLGHVQNGGQGWRVSLEKLCVGRECDKTHQLAASLKVNKVSVKPPS